MVLQNFRRKLHNFYQPALLTLFLDEPDSALIELKPNFGTTLIGIGHYLLVLYPRYIYAISTLHLCSIEKRRLLWELYNDRKELCKSYGSDRC